MFRGIRLFFLYVSEERTSDGGGGTMGSSIWRLALYTCFKDSNFPQE